MEDLRDFNHGFKYLTRLIASDQSPTVAARLNEEKDDCVTAEVTYMWTSRAAKCSALYTN